MLGIEVMQRWLSNRFCSPEDQAIEIFVKSPFNFALYQKLALRGEFIPLPYIYSTTSWRCTIRTRLGKDVPTHVSPNKDESPTHLVVKFLCDYSTSEERELKESIKQVFCSELDLLPFYQKASRNAKFFEVVKKLIGLKPYLSQDPFEALIKAVIRQLIRADVARRSIAMIVFHFGTKKTITGRSYYGFPSPKTLSSATKHQLAECNVGYKWRLIKKLSYDIVSGDLDLYELAGLSDEKIIQTLTEYAGIGYWTSRIFLYDGLKKLNAYPIRDISIRKAISLIYFQRKPISWEEVELFFRDYEDFIGVATNYLFGALWLERSIRCIQTQDFNVRENGWPNNTAMFNFPINFCSPTENMP